MNIVVSVKEERRQFADELCTKYSINPIIARILSTRNIRTVEDAYDFLHPDYDKLTSPTALENCCRIVDYLNGIPKDTPIAVVGDYDVDGVTGSYIMKKGLSIAGFTDIKAYIPMRNDGYGLNVELVKGIINDGRKLIITVDNGITSYEAVEFCTGNNIDIIITDHHEIAKDKDNNEIYPNAKYIMNPKLNPAQNKNAEYLCGAGVAYYLMRALIGDTEQLKDELLPLVAIATICDVVPLVYDNRVIVNEGLELLKKGKNIGIDTLLKRLGLNTDELVESDFGYKVGPCINAAGRMSSAMLALELLEADNLASACDSADDLIELNSRRKELTENGFIEARKQINDCDKVNLITLNHEFDSIAGIIAGDITKRTIKPTIVLCSSKDGDSYKGSGRSVEEYNMYEQLRTYDSYISFGGHKMACGCSIAVNDFNSFREYFNKSAETLDANPTLYIHPDIVIDLDDVSVSLAKDINRLGPFGNENPIPVIMLKNVKITSLRKIGCNMQYLSFMALSNKTNSRVKCVMWNGVEDMVSDLERAYDAGTVKALYAGTSSVYCTIVGELRTNEWNGSVYPQIVVKHIKLGKDV